MYSAVKIKNAIQYCRTNPLKNPQQNHVSESICAGQTDVWCSLACNQIVLSLMVIFCFYMVSDRNWVDVSYCIIAIERCAAIPVNTQSICITFVQCWTNVEDVGPTLYKCYTNALCLLGLYLGFVPLSWLGIFITAGEIGNNDDLSKRNNIITTMGLYT